MNSSCSSWVHNILYSILKIKIWGLFKELRPCINFNLLPVKFNILCSSRLYHIKPSYLDSISSTDFSLFFLTSRSHLSRWVWGDEIPSCTVVIYLSANILDIRAFVNKHFEGKISQQIMMRSGEMQSRGAGYWLADCVKLIIPSEQPERSDHESACSPYLGRHSPGWCLPAVRRDSYVWMEIWWDYEMECRGRGCLCLAKTWFTAKQCAFVCLRSLVLKSEGPCAPESVIVNP